MPSATLTNPTVRQNIFVALSENTLIGSVKQSYNPTMAVSSSAGTFPQGNIDLVVSYALSIANGSPYTLNVHSCTDPLGNTVVFAHVLGFQVENDGTVGTGIYTVGGGTHPLFGSDQYTVQPGGSINNTNPNPGWVVSSGSADTITISCSSGAVAGVLTVIGRST